MSIARILLLIAFSVSFFITASPAQAAENPLAVANNKVGIHILDPNELAKAAELVNSNGGSWGYVIVPIQAKDKDLAKWQSFMNECKRKRIIPIIRLATEGDYFNTSVWREPTHMDTIDFANFLNSLDWPTKNRYVVVYNEVNRGDEWGGNANPSEYAQILSFAVSVFKSKNQDFFMISAGMDNAAPNEGTKYIDAYEYLKQMNDAIPGIFNQIDGLSSHAYPNPGFSQPPDTVSTTGTGSFMHERDLVGSMTKKKLPIFITETGWSAESVPDDKRAQYYEQAFTTIWNDPNIVAVTPFLLQAGAGPFEKFSFLTATGQETKQYQWLKNFKKIKGIPSYPTRSVLGAKDIAHPKSEAEITRDFTDYQKPHRSISLSSTMQSVFNYLIGNPSSYIAK